jgi:hypothetical protein
MRQVWPMPGLNMLRGQRPVMRGQRRLGVIEVADIVLGGIFGAAPVEQRQHRLFQRRNRCPWPRYNPDGKRGTGMAVIELVQDRMLDGGSVLDPVLAIAGQGDVERDDVSTSWVHRAIAVGRTRRGKAVQEGGIGLFGSAFEKAPVSEGNGAASLRLGCHRRPCAGSGDVLIAVAPFQQARRQMRGSRSARPVAAPCR